MFTKWQEKATDPGCFTSDGPFAFCVWMIDSILIPWWYYLIATRQLFLEVLWLSVWHPEMPVSLPWRREYTLNGSFYRFHVLQSFRVFVSCLSLIFFFSFSLLPRLLIVSEWPADPVHHSAAWPEPQWDPTGKSCCCTCPWSLHPLLLPSSGQNLFIFLILNCFRMHLINHEIWDLNLFAMVGLPSCFRSLAYVVFSLLSPFWLLPCVVNRLSAVLCEMKQNPECLLREHKRR